MEKTRGQHDIWKVMQHQQVTIFGWW